MDVEKVFKFYIAGKGIKKLCPSCDMPLFPCRCVIPAYNRDGSFFSFFQGTLSYCWSCDTYWIEAYAFEQLIKHLNDLRDKKYVKPANRRAVFSRSDQKYIYIDTPAKDNFVEGEWWEEEDSNPYIKREDKNWSKTSVLKRMGYDVNRSTVILHSILEDAAKKYSKKEVISFLNFLIKMHKNHPNDYSQSILTWQNDVEYVRTLRL